jgi:hypothetical protein
MSTLARVVYSPDTTPPTVPGSAAASALSQTTIRITWAASTDTGGSGLAGYRVYRSTTSTGTYSQVGSDLTTSSLSYDDTGLTAGTTRFYRVVAFDGNGNVSAQSSIASATTTAASSGNNGQVGSYANLNLASFPIYSVDMALRDYFMFATGSAGAQVDQTTGFAGSGSQVHNTNGWWDGGAFCRITPPTTDQYERGVQITNLHRNGTLGIQDFNLRFEIRYGPTIASAYQTQNNGCKHSLVMCSPSIGGPVSSSSRPVYFISPSTTADSATYRRSATLGFAPAANTLVAYGQDAYNEEDVATGGTNTYYINGPQAFYLVDQADSITSFNSKPCFKGGDFLTCEYRIIPAATAQYPRGLIAYKYTNRAGVWVERGIPWDYKNFMALGQFLDSVQQFGCGQFNVALPAGSGNYFDIGGYFTVARNYNGWLGPRSGFVN